jgi:hypothetical protein
MSREVFTRELRMIREQTRGHVRVQASFGCQNPRCAVTTVTIVFEETDESLPAQAPVYCNTGDRTEAAQALDRAIKRAEIEAGNLGRRVGDRTDVEEKMLWKALLGQIELSKLTRDQVR